MDRRECHTLWIGRVPTTKISRSLRTSIPMQEVLILACVWDYRCYPDFDDRDHIDDLLKGSEFALWAFRVLGMPACYAVFLLIR